MRRPRSFEVIPEQTRNVYYSKYLTWISPESQGVRSSNCIYVFDERNTTHKAFCIIFIKKLKLVFIFPQFPSEIIIIQM